MNSILISLGAVLVAALTVALVGPSFVDWNAYRAQIEAEGARLAGRPIAIGGDIDMHILPEPVIEIAEVQVLRADSEEPLVEAEAANLNLSLGALLLGRIEITDLILESPIVRLAVREGGLDWGVEAEPLEGAAAAVFRRIEARDARFEFADPSSGLDVVLDGVDMQVAGAGVHGPFKVTGRYGVAGSKSAERPGFSFTLGTLSPNGPIKLAGRFDLEPLGQLSLDGQLVSLAQAPGFDGKVRLEHALASRSATSGERPRLVVLADADLGLRRGALDNVRISLTGAERPITMAGSASASFEGRPRFRAQVATRQIDLDAVAEGFADKAMLVAVTDAFEPVAAWLSRNDARAELRVSADGAVLYGDLVRGFTAAVDVEPDLVRLTALEGTFPGQTSLSLSGEARLGETARFVGRLNAETLELGRFAHWATPKDDVWVGEVFGDSRGRLSMNGELEIESDRLTLQVPQGFLNQSPFSGELAIEREDGRPRLVADLSFDRVDLDRYVPAKARLIDVTTATGIGQAPDFALDLKARRLEWRGRSAEGAAVRIAHAGGALEVERLRIDRFAGAELGLTGRLVPGPEGPSGAIDIELKTQDLAGFAEAVGNDVPPLMRLAEAAPMALGSADLNLHLEGSGPGEPAASSLKLDGTVSGLAVDIAATSDAPAGRAGEGSIELDARLSAENLRAVDGLAEALGLGADSLPEQAGSLELNATGRPADGFVASASLTALDAASVAEGRITTDPIELTGTLSTEAKSVAVLARALGWPAPRRDIGMTATAKAAYGPGRLALSDIAATLGDDTVTGAIEAELAVEPTQVRLRLDPASASLPWIAAAIFSPPDRTPGGVAEGRADPRRPAWSTELVDVDRLANVGVEASGTVGELALVGDLKLKDAAYEISLRDSALELKQLSGKMDDAEVRLSGIARGSGEAMLDISGELAVSGGALSRVLGDGQGRALLSGKADVEGRFTAAGRSLLSLVSSLSGSGELSLSDVDLVRFDAGHVIDGTAEAPDAEAVEALIEAGRAGSTPLGATTAAVEAINGRIKIGPARLAAPGLSGEATSFIDLPSRRFDQELVLEGTEEQARLALIHAGPFEDIRREVELTDLPVIGAARWTEPLDGYDPPVADAGVTAGLAREGNKSDAEGVVPTRLIDRRVVDLPILEGATPTQ